MLAAARALRTQRPKTMMVAVSVASHDACEAFRRHVDKIVCGETPEPFYAVGAWYEDFSQTSDAEVQPCSNARPRSESRREDLMSGVSAPDLDILRTAAHRLADGKVALDPLIDLAGDASFVLLGEATHGTHEFYSTRAAITERLIKEKGFHAVAVEADWPDAGICVTVIARCGLKPVPLVKPCSQITAESNGAGSLCHAPAQCQRDQDDQPDSSTQPERHLLACWALNHERPQAHGPRQGNRDRIEALLVVTSLVFQGTLHLHHLFSP